MKVRLSDQRLASIRYWFENLCPVTAQDYMRDLLNEVDRTREPPLPAPRERTYEGRDDQVQGVAA